MTRAKSIECTAKSCIFTQTHVMLDPCGKTCANSRRNMQNPHQFSRNESRVTEKKVARNFTKMAFFDQKVLQCSNFSRKASGCESARFFTNLHVCKMCPDEALLQNHVHRDSFSMESFQKKLLLTVLSLRLMVIGTISMVYGCIAYKEWNDEKNGMLGLRIRLRPGKR